MHFHLPKPLHGWREFAGEVGVIVLGVLMALGAQKVLQDIQLSGDITAFRGTIDQEIAANLYAYDVRVRQADCVDKHLDQVEAWLARSRSGRTVSLRAGAPASISLYRSAWDNRNAEIFNSLPDKFRAKYAEFYDELANNKQILEREREEWRVLGGFSEPGPLSLQDRRLIRNMLNRARGDAGSIVGNASFSRKIASDLGIGEAAPEGTTTDDINRINQIVSTCRPFVEDSSG